MINKIIIQYNIQKNNNKSLNNKNKTKSKIIKTKNLYWKNKKI